MFSGGVYQEEPQRMVKGSSEQQVLRYFHLALHTGKKMIVVPVRREAEGNVCWKIYLQSLVAAGEERISELDVIDELV